MKKIGICGHYGLNDTCIDGQTIKTKIITQTLINEFGKDEISIVDTQGGIKRFFAHIFNMCNIVKKCENIIILPAHNGIRVFAPLLCFLNYFYHRKNHYIVIGGWLPYFLSKRMFLSKCLKKFNFIYVETSTMKKQLEMEGFDNITVLPNCKNLKILNKKDLIFNTNKPFRICTFSRVTKQKGINDAIKAIRYVNETLNELIFTLDIYGPISKEYEDYFKTIQKSFPDYIHYKGCVDYDKTVDVLKNYYALLFPTKYFTEGVPGTIIDAYSAGVPVIASKWASFNDVVDEGIVGLGYTFSDYDSLVNTLIYISKNPNLLVNMKNNCLKKAYEFNSDTVIHKIIKEKFFI